MKKIGAIIALLLLNVACTQWMGTNTARVGGIQHQPCNLLMLREMPELCSQPAVQPVM